jgi:succinate dehydrogenase flavin-adding protein (antitoxin of CptAB toxin-antitoxin module)
LDIVGTTVEVPDPKYLSNSMLMTQQHFEEQIEELKRTSAEKFDNMIEFTHDDIDNWLVEYTNKNEDIENILQNLSVDLREIEKELFNVKIKQEVIISPLRDFIQEWLNNSIAKISEIPAEVVMTGNQTATNKSIKETTTSK